jgi:hypothetical protein
MLQPANPDILEGVDDLIKLSYLNEPAVLHDLTHRYAQDKIYVRANTSLIPASKVIWGYPCASKRIFINLQISIFFMVNLQGDQFWMFPQFWHSRWLQEVFCSCSCAFQIGLVDMLTNIPIGCAD